MAVLTRGFANERGDDLALVDDNGSRSWAEFDQRVNQLIHAMRSAGIGTGDTIAMVVGNSNEWFEIGFACANAGVTFVPVNWHLVGPEIAYILADSDAKAVFVSAEFVETVTAALADPATSAVATAVSCGGPAHDRFVDYEVFIGSQPTTDPEDQSFGGPMFYTSGTTGHPKGVRGSLSSMPNGTDPAIWQFVGASVAGWIPAPGRTVLCGPAYHSAQWAFSFLPMITGSATIMQHRYDSAAVLDLIDTHQATNIHLVPTQMKRLIDLPAEVKAGFDGSSLELVLHGAAPCPPVVKQAMIEWWGPKVTEYYGSTEGSVISLITSEEWLERGGSVGKPNDDVEVLVVADDGTRLGPNESGTLYFRSDRGFEYHKAPDKTEAAHLEPGVFTTGDVGYLDDDGYMWLSDRKIDMIISGGVNIYPAEIEGVLGGHDLVADVTVIGVPNDEFGEEVKAVVVLNDGVPADADTEGTLRSFCREQLAGFKVPRSIDFVAALPRTGTGKVQKRKVREPYWSDHNRSI